MALYSGEKLTSEINQMYPLLIGIFLNFCRLILIQTALKDWQCVEW